MGKGPIFFISVALIYGVAAIASKAFLIDTLKNCELSVKRAVIAVIGSAILAISMAFVLKTSSQYSRLEFCYIVLGCLILISGSRFLLALLIQNKLEGIISEKVFILGDEKGLSKDIFVSPSITMLDVHKEGWDQGI